MPSFCTQCDAALPAEAKFREECGTQVSKSTITNSPSQERNTILPETPADPAIEWAARAARQAPSPGGRIITGIVCALSGLSIYLWASSHSPHMDFGAMLMNGLDNYIIKEPAYSVIILIAAGLGLTGIALLIAGAVNGARK
jgi:hypothetical protein